MGVGTPVYTFFFFPFFPHFLILPFESWRNTSTVGSRGAIDARCCGTKSSKNRNMEEEIKNIVTACIVANVPVIAQAVIDKLNEQPKKIKTLSRREAANSLGVSLPTFDTLIDNGTIRARKVGRRVLIPESEVLSLLESNEPYKYQRRVKA